MRQEILKICARCKKQKAVSEFNRQQKNLDGLQAYCKSCGIEYKQDKKRQGQERDKIFFNPNTPAF